MASFTRTLKDFVAGESPTANNMDSLSKGVPGHEVSTTPTNGIIAVTTVMSVTATTLAGRLYRISADGNLEQSSASALERFAVSIKEGATTFVQRGFSNVTTLIHGYHVDAYVTSLSAGAHTFIVTVERTAGGGTVNHALVSSSPGYVTVEDLGPNA